MQLVKGKNGWKKYRSLQLKRVEGAAFRENIATIVDFPVLVESIVFKDQNGYYLKHIIVNTIIAKMLIAAEENLLNPKKK